jgi:hypothetical protein
MADKSKIDFMPYWKNEQKCYDEVIVTGKDYHGKKATITWPRDKPIAQKEYENWLKKIQDPDTGKFYEQRDKNGNTIKGTGPKHLIRQIVRVRTSDDKEFLYSNGFLVGFNALGDPVHEVCSNPETWQQTEFAYKKEFDPKTMSVKSIVIGPTNVETIYEMPFNEKNLKQLFEKRITHENVKLLHQTRMGDTVLFAIKDGRTGQVHDVKDATGIDHKTLELFLKPFDYLANSDYLTPEQKAQARQRAIDMGLLPGGAQVQYAPGPGLKPPSGTYG